MGSGGSGGCGGDGEDDDDDDDDDDEEDDDEEDEEDEDEGDEDQGMPPVAPVQLSAARYAAFVRETGRVFRERRVDEMPLQQLRATSAAMRGFSVHEARAALVRMAQENKAMLADGVVYLI